MPQDMVVSNLAENDTSTAVNPFSGFPCLRPPVRPHLLRLVMNGDVKQTSSPYTPKYLLIKTPYRFNTDYQSLVPNSTCVRCDWALYLDVQRSWP